MRPEMANCLHQTLRIQLINAFQIICSKYFSSLVVGILGGSAGTTYDAFRMVECAKRDGARVALFGRKINNAECQFSFLRCLRLVADGELAADQAVRDYHGRLQTQGIPPARSLEVDLHPTQFKD